jgi:hypothetical protein
VRCGAKAVVIWMGMRARVQLRTRDDVEGGGRCAPSIQCARKRQGGRSAPICMVRRVVSADLTGITRRAPTDVAPASDESIHGVIAMMHYATLLVRSTPFAPIRARRV